MKQINAAALAEALQTATPPVLLDVREDFEREAFHIGGIWIPLAELIHQKDRIPQDQPVVIYCRKGIRSQIAIQKLEDRFGFSNLINLEGGMDAWHKAGLARP
jgi:rhodanese-related sulfurtransferase